MAYRDCGLDCDCVGCCAKGHDKSCDCGQWPCKHMEFTAPPKVKIDGDYLTLSTGRSFYANGAILGLGPYGDRLQSTNGYDGGIEFDHDYDDEPKFTAAERTEIAEYMGDLWRKWAAQA